MQTHKKNPFVAVSAIWYERFLECSRTYGTDIFTKSVWRFYHSLLNLGEGKLAIKNIVYQYYTEEYLPELEYRINESIDSKNVTYGLRKGIKALEEQRLIVNLFEYIIQTIQDSGVGWPTYVATDEAWDYDDSIKD